jgi:hypothetical protein
MSTSDSSGLWKPHEDWPLVGPKRDRPESEEETDPKRCRKDEEEHHNPLVPRFDRNDFSVADNIELEIKESKIPGAGLGLFALREFWPEEPITIYNGEVITYSEAKKREVAGKDSHIAMHIPLAWSIDGSKVAFNMNTNVHDSVDPKTELFQRSAGAMANDARDPSKTNAELAHVDSDVNKLIWEKTCERLNPWERFTYLRATKTIMPGDEIYLDYGERYWQKVRDRQLRKG